MTAITDAVTLARAGSASDARAALEELWAGIGPGGDPLHRCTLAHYLADLYDDAAASLEWDIRALAAADDMDDRRVREHHESLRIRGFYPSLHLNLADDYRRLGDFDSAAGHLAAARDYADALADDGYGAGVLGGIDNVAAAIAARNTERLATH